MNAIQSLDLNDFLSEDPLKKTTFIKNIGDAFHEIGFVALKGHFLKKELSTELYDEIKRFFDLPDSIKKSYEIKGIGGQRGYTAFGTESAKGKKEADLKEFWHFGQYNENFSKTSESYPPNVIVKELPHFNTVGKQAYELLEKTAIYVLRAIAIHLGLDEYYFDRYVVNGNSILRPIHYPPIQTKPLGAERAAAHGDINLITLLMGAQGKGLQVQNKKGVWIDAIAAPDELMINVGDMLSRLTNNKLKSTIHRVLNPAEELWGTSRYSIPFFMHPIATMKLNCLKECIDENNPKEYEDTSAGSFLRERLIELGLIKEPV